MRLGLIDRIRSNAPGFSLAFLGLGVLQAWMLIMTSQAGIGAGMPYNYMHLCIDMGSLAMYALLLVLSRRIAPLFNQERAPWVALAFMLIGNGLVIVGALLPQLPAVVSFAGLVVVGASSAYMVIAWLEAYSVFSPVTVALLYASSWVIRELVTFALEGYNRYYLAGASFLLPIVVLLMFNASRGAIRQAKVEPKKTKVHAAFPWKPMLLVALYSFAYGCGTWVASYNTVWTLRMGTLIPSLLVCACILFPKGVFNFQNFYRFVLPTAMATLLLGLSNLNENLASIFMQVSSTAVFIYVTVVMASLSRHYHLNAAHLFSLFYVTHICALGVGTLTYYVLPSFAIIGICIACIVMVTFITLTEPSLTSDWRIALSNQGEKLSAQAQRELAVDEMSTKHGLSAREREVLLLLVEGNTPRAIGNELHIAPGTAKSHVQRIYKKIGIHSREELLDLLR